MDTGCTVSFRLIGADADDHLLGLRDASSFVDAASEMAYVLEFFRCYGCLPGPGPKDLRIASRLKVRAPRASSWSIDIVAVAAGVLAEAAIKVSLEALIGWVQQKISAYRNNWLSVTAEQKQPPPLAVPPAVDCDAVDKERAALAEVNYTKVIELFVSILDNAPSEVTNALLRRMQEINRKLALPLKDSAARLEITVGESRALISTIDRRSALTLYGYYEGDKEFVFTGKVTTFSTDTGYGTLLSNDSPHQLYTFVVPPAFRRIIAGRLLSCTLKTNVQVVARAVYDQEDEFSYLVLHDLFAYTVESDFRPEIPPYAPEPPMRPIDSSRPGF